MNCTEESVMKEIKELMTSLGIETFPTRHEMEYTVLGLLGRIGKVGGSKYLSEKYGIPLKRETRIWTDELIEKELVQVVNTLNIDYFPTRKEMREVCKNDALASRISHGEGYKYWANKLGLKIKDGDTFFGHNGEDKLKNILTDKGYEVERLSTNCVYDFLVNKEVRVDCKISKLYHGSNGNFYAYNLERPNPDCDLFILITEGDDGKNRVMIVPQQIVKGQKQISIGEFNSKWYAYENRFDLIDEYVNFYNRIYTIV